jgi:hypothetical protein
VKIKSIVVNGDLNNLKPIEADGYYELQEDVEVIIELEDLRQIIVIGYEGYHFDYASIPNFLEWFLKPDHEMMVLASFVHDICCHWQYVNVKFSAELMYKMMQYYIKTKVLSKLKKLNYNIKSYIVFLALYFSRTAKDAFYHTTVVDDYNKNFSFIT